MLTRWRYCSLAQNHQYTNIPQNMHTVLLCFMLFISYSLVDLYKSFANMYLNFVAYKFKLNQILDLGQKLRLDLWRVQTYVNSLAPGRSECDSKNIISSLVLLIGIFRSSHDNAFWWMLQDLTVDASTLIQVMAWCCQATSHYLSQCWPRPMSPNGVTRPQWVETEMSQHAANFFCTNHRYKIPQRQCLYFGKCQYSSENINNTHEIEENPMKFQGPHEKLSASSTSGPSWISNNVQNMVELKVHQFENSWANLISFTSLNHTMTCDFNGWLHTWAVITDLTIMKAV